MYHAGKRNSSEVASFCSYAARSAVCNVLSIISGTSIAQVKMYVHLRFRNNTYTNTKGMAAIKNARFPIKIEIATSSERYSVRPTGTKPNIKNL